MPNRFVILHHRQDHGEHWDLMLESGDVLLTWQLLHDPTGHDPFPIPARRIGDHRKAYLTYEGALTGGRGTVTRLDGGLLDLGTLAADSCEFSLQGSRLAGRFRLCRETEDRWTLAKVGTG